MYAALLLQVNASAIAMERENIGNLAPESGATFGASMAADGDTLIVGEPGASKVHVFRQNNGEWRRTRVIRPPENDAQFGPDRPGFGYSVAVNSSQVLVGAYREQSAGDVAGAAFVGSNMVGYFGAVYKTGINENSNVGCLHGPCAEGWVSGSVAGYAVRLDDDFTAFAVRQDRGDGVWLGRISVISVSGHEVSISPEGVAQITFAPDFDMKDGSIAVLAPTGDGNQPQVFIYGIELDGGYVETSRWLLEVMPSKIAMSESYVIATSHDRSGHEASYLFDRARSGFKKLDGNGIPSIGNGKIVLFGEHARIYEYSNTIKKLKLIKDLRSAKVFGAYMYCIESNNSIYRMH